MIDNNSSFSLFLFHSFWRPSKNGDKRETLDIMISHDSMTAMIKLLFSASSSVGYDIQRDAKDQRLFTSLLESRIRGI